VKTISTHIINLLQTFFCDENEDGKATPSAVVLLVGLVFLRAAENVQAVVSTPVTRLRVTAIWKSEQKLRARLPYFLTIILLVFFTTAHGKNNCSFSLSLLINVRNKQKLH